MQKSKLIFLVLLVVASIISVVSEIGWTITKSAAQSINAKLDHPYKQLVIGREVRLSPEEQTTHDNHIYPDNTTHCAIALNNKGLALEKLGNDSGAIFFYKKALAIEPNNTEILDNMGMALNSSGNYTGAVEYYNRALAIDPNDEEALYNKGNALDQLGFPTF